MSVNRFRARQTVQRELKDAKANKKPQRTVLAGNGDGATVNVPNRDNFYYIRIEDEDSQVVWFSEAYSGIPLSYDDRVVVQKAEDEKLTYYEVVAWIEDSGGGTTPPIPDHDHDGTAGSGGNLDWDDIWSDAVHDHSSNAEGGQSLRQLLQLGLDESTTVTINAGGAITVTQAYHDVDTNGGAATDNLDTINGRTEPDFLVVRPTNDARTVVVRHGAGNIVLQGGADITLDDIEDHILLLYDPTNAVWVDFGGGGGVNWGQTVVVAVSGGDYTSVNAACVAVAAVPPAAATPWTILVMSGVFTEAGGFLVPTYTTLMGRGESTVIDIVDSVWAVDDYGCVMDCVIKSTCTSWGYCCALNNRAEVVLWNVKTILNPSHAFNNYAFYVAGTTTAEFYHCIVEATGAGTETVGWYHNGSATVRLWDCKANDTTNIDNGLELASTGGVVTKFCQFKAADDDVIVGANATWTYHGDDFDYENCTINGAAEPNDGQTTVWFDWTIDVPTDFATIQNAIDHAAGRIPVGTITIDVAAGTYNETLDISGIFCRPGGVVLQGDTRVLVGAHYVSGDASAAAWVNNTVYAAGNIVLPTAGGDFYYKCQVGGTSAPLPGGEPAWPTTIGNTIVDNTITWITCGIRGNMAGLANGGTQDGATMLASAGNTVTTTITAQGGGAGNPDFQTGGIVNGDTVYIYNNAGATTLYTVSATAANVITLTVAAPAVGNLGTALALRPNRIISAGANDAITNAGGVGVDIIGFAVEVTGANKGLSITNNGYTEYSNLLIHGDNTAAGYGIYVESARSYSQDVTTVFECADGVFAYNMAQATAYYHGCIDCNTRGFNVYFFAEAYVQYSIVSGNVTIGYATQLFGFLGNTGCYSLNAASQGLLAQNFSLAFMSTATASTDCFYVEGTTTGVMVRYQSFANCQRAMILNCTTGYYSGYNAYITALNTTALMAGCTTNYSPAVSDTEGNVYAIITFS